MVSEVSNEGLGINGKWVNTRTNETILVRDSLIEDGNNMILITNKGRLSFEEFSNNYVQISDEEVNNVQVDNNSAPTKNEDGQPIFDVIEINQSYKKNSTAKEKTVEKQNSTAKEEKQSEVIVEAKSNQFDMIDKIFSTDNIIPEIKITIDCNNFPINELTMLKKFFNITDEDIAIYIKNKFITNDKITKSIENYIAKM